MGAHNSHRAVGIGWNEWSASIGTRGRHPLERVVDFSGIRTGQWLSVKETPNGWLEIFDGNKLVASHLMLPESARFRPVLQPSHHQLPQGEAQSLPEAPAPEVEERPLAVYEAFAAGRVAQ